MSKIPLVWMGGAAQLEEIPVILLDPALSVAGVTLLFSAA